MFCKVSSDLTWFHKQCINILKLGKVPRHIALIMDGNRRFAKKNHIETKLGHSKGFEQLSRTWQWCVEIGITELTVYAFSIENFKRDPEEVATLLELAKQKFQLVLDDIDNIMQNGTCVQVFGNLSLLPPDMQQMIAEIMLITKDNKKRYLNFGFAYTSRDEITNAISTVVNGVQSGLIQENDIDEELLSNCLYINKKRGPDLLIRTSGETRLSDFLLCQLEHSYILFNSELWPEFSIWHLFYLVFIYQRKCVKKEPESATVKSLNCSQKFLESVEASRWSLLREYLTFK